MLLMQRIGSDIKVKHTTLTCSRFPTPIVSILLEVTPNPSSLHLWPPYLPSFPSSSLMDLLVHLNYTKNTAELEYLYLHPSVWNPFPQWHDLLYNDLIYLNVTFPLCLKMQSPYIRSILLFPDLVFVLTMITMITC